MERTLSQIRNRPIQPGAAFLSLAAVLYVSLTIQWWPQKTSKTNGDLRLWVRLFVIGGGCGGGMLAPNARLDRGLGAFGGGAEGGVWSSLAADRALNASLFLVERVLLPTCSYCTCTTAPSS